MNRRDLLKLSGLTVAATTIAGCSASSGAKPSEGVSTQNTKTLLGATNGKRVVVIGAGFGGLTVAKYLKKANKDIEVVVLEKRDNFMSCPYSNTWLGGVMDVTNKAPVTLDTLSYDYYAPATKYGYKLIQTTVTAIDRTSRVVTTTCGTVGYDYLVIAPGIIYDYSKLFGNDKDMASRCLMECPPALMPGSEHIALKRQLVDMEEGNFVIVVPESAYRCPPAPYERAAMVAYYMKKNDIKGKVLILDPREKPVAKPKEFMEVYGSLYPNIVEYHKNTFLKSVNLDKKELTVIVREGEKETEKVVKYAVANIIPKNVGSPVMKMAGVKTNGDGYALVKLPLHTALNQDGTADDRVFVLGDSIAATNFAAGSGYPKSGHMANAQGIIVATQISSKIAGIPNKGLELPNNTCYSIVNGDPKEAVVVNHKVEFIVEDVNGQKVEKVKVTARTGARSGDLGKSTDGWYVSIMKDLFN
jgi:NADH dehydrogenase FAD-containing subunit